MEGNENAAEASEIVESENGSGEVVSATKSESGNANPGRPDLLAEANANVNESGVVPNPVAEARDPANVIAHRVALGPRVEVGQRGARQTPVARQKQH